MNLHNAPAFPETEYAGNTNRHPVDGKPGMTYRQWLVGLCLQGLMANGPNWSEAAEVSSADHMKVGHAVRMADMLIAELEKSDG